MPRRREAPTLFITLPPSFGGLGLALALMLVGACGGSALPPPSPAPTAAQNDKGSIVKRTVQANFGQLTWCYEQALRKDPDLAGTVKTEWHVEGGSVTHAAVLSNTTGSDEMGECLVRKISSWTFPEHVAGQIVYPFIFKPKPN